MNALSVPVVLMAGLSIYVAVYHLMIYARRRQRRGDLTFALLCLANALYDVFCAGLYNAGSVAEGAGWQKAQFIALALFSTVFLWFIADYTGRKAGALTWILSGLFLVGFIVQIVDRSALTFDLASPSIKSVEPVAGLRVIYREAALGPFTAAQSLLGVVFTLYVFQKALRFFIRGDRKKAGPLFGALCFMIIAAFNDTFVSNGLYHFIYLIEYSFLALIVAMAFTISSEVVEAAVAREALRESEERFRALVETTSDWVWETDPRGVYTYSSPKVAELLGYGPDEIRGRALSSLVPPEDAGRIEAAFREAAAAARPFARLETAALRRDGRRIVLETSGVPFFADSGELLGFRGIDRDITERKKAEEALRQANIVIENSPVVLFRWIAAEGWPVQFVSENVAQFGYSAAELENVRFDSLVYPDDRERVAREVEENAAAGADVFAQTYRIVAREGGARWVEDRTFVERGSDGTVTHFQGIVVDVTERKRAEDEILRLNAGLERSVAERTAQLENALRELEAFSYSVSHDLRAPLRALSGHSRILLDDYAEKLPAEAARRLSAIDESGRVLGRLVDGLLNLSRLNRRELDRRRVSMDGLAREALDDFVEERRGRNVEIAVGKLPDCDGDPVLLRQVWCNLISNAFKFTGKRPDARVEIGCGEREGGNVYFVKDNGSGFDMRHAGKLFGVFQRLHRSDEFEGTGIGLATVRRIVERHGGRIWAEAEPGKGAAFYFTIG
ncbi:MAG: PAS domain S-box protein [Spirochaetales bacterium]|nr:PAS domain S-box protein [Spirochaetales bacterium]